MKKSLTRLMPGKKGTMHATVIEKFVFVVMGILLLGSAIASDSPKLNANARGGDCQACHKQEVLPQGHGETKEMKITQCMTCHKEDSPGLFTKLPLSHRHFIDGISCEDCHGTAEPPVFVDKDTCMQCHAPEGLVEATSNTHPANPHDSHYGPELDCDLCHHVHAPSENFCNQCHEFEFVVPSPILKDS